MAPQVSEPVRRAIERGLEKRPENRFSDVRELVAVDARSRTSFETAERLMEVLNREESAEELMRILSQEHQLSDEVVTTVTDIPSATVARLRRRAARAALVGPSGKPRGRRSDITKKTTR